MPRDRRPSLLSPFAYGRRAGLYKGVLGGDRQWLIIGALFWCARLIRKSFGKVQEVVAIEKMEPGQWMSLRTITPLSRRERRAATKALSERSDR